MPRFALPRIPKIAIGIELGKQLPDIEAPLRPLLEKLEQIETAFDKSLGPFKELEERGKRIARQAKSAELIDEAGWLPHYTNVGLLRTGSGQPDEIRCELSAHYRERWSDVRDEIESHLAEYRVDDEAKSTFEEALDAHEAGLYRCVCRVLMPEVERVVRTELHDGDLGARIASQKDLRELARHVPITAIKPGGFFHLQLYRRLSEHAYVHVGDAEKQQRLQIDPVPNRHAAVHGLVAYSTFENSLNALFLTEYVFQVVSALKALPG